VVFPAAENNVLSISHGGTQATTAMSPQESTTEDGTIEECLDEMNDFVATLGRFPPMVLAVALRVHLGTLLSTLLERGSCTRPEVLDFVNVLESEALQDADD
jgi:hypothetical protein